MVGKLVVVCIDRDMERGFAKQWLPKVLAQVVAAVERYVMNQDAFVGFLEGFGCQFFFQETDLLVAQLGEVVQAGVFTMVIGLVFATIQYHNAGVAPVESSVSLSAYIIEMLAKTDGVGIAYFVVPADEESGSAVAVYSFGE